MKREFAPNYRLWSLLGIREKDWGQTPNKAFQCGQALERGCVPGRDAQDLPRPSSLWAKALRLLMKTDISRRKKK